jgi:hypothetical protein
MAGREWICIHNVGHPYATDYPNNVHGCCEGSCCDRNFRPPKTFFISTKGKPRNGMSAMAIKFSDVIEKKFGKRLKKVQKIKYPSDDFLAIQRALNKSSNKTKITNEQLEKMTLCSLEGFDGEMRLGKSQIRKLLKSAGIEVEK